MEKRRRATISHKEGWYILKVQVKKDECRANEKVRTDIQTN